MDPRTLTRRTLLALAALWPFARPGAGRAQPVPARRPAHVADPRPGGRYWCVVRPFEMGKQRPFPVRLPWKGRLVPAVWGDDLVLSIDPYIAVKPSPRDLFRTEAEARAAIAWDWEHPPGGSEVTLAFAPSVLGRLLAALKGYRESEGPEDGAVRGLAVVTLERAAAQQLLATAALALGCTVLPNLERDEPAR